MPRKRVAPQSEVIRFIVMEDSPCCEVPHLEVIPVEEDLYGVDWTWRKRCVEDRVVGSPAVSPNLRSFPLEILDLLELGRREVWGEPHPVRVEFIWLTIKCVALQPTSVRSLRSGEANTCGTRSG